MPYAVRCYEGNDEWVSKKWLAHLNLGNDIYMSFFGATKKEAEDKAHSWYAKEEKHFHKIYKEDKPKEPTVKVINDVGFVTPTVDNGWSGWGEDAVWSDDNQKKITNRGHHLVGKVWMVNKILGKKVRIDKELVAQYEADGYIKGGPRS